MVRQQWQIQWGNRKRLRCVKVKIRDLNNNNQSIKNKNDDKLLTTESLLGKKKVTSHVDHCVIAKETASPYHRVGKKSDSPMNVCKSLALSPEKEDRYYTRGSSGMDENRNGKFLKDRLKEAKGDFVWPRLYLSLSNKEKEEDFMAMKGCKLPQRPKKRAKLIQKTILLVSPGAWLTDLCQERYEVREKKTSKKRPRGLKALESMESDSA